MRRSVSRPVGAFATLFVEIVYNFFQAKIYFSTKFTENLIVSVNFLFPQVSCHYGLLLGRNDCHNYHWNNSNFHCHNNINQLSIIDAMQTCTYNGHHSWFKQSTIHHQQPSAFCHLCCHVKNAAYSEFELLIFHLFKYSRWFGPRPSKKQSHLPHVLSHWRGSGFGTRLGLVWNGSRKWLWHQRKRWNQAHQHTME